MSTRRVQLLCIRLLFCSAFFIFVKTAEAAKCAEFHSLETSFIKVDTVLSGVALSSGNEVQFSSLAYYKSPLGLREAPEKLKIYSADLNFHEGKEYVVFGNLRQEIGKEKMVISYSCLGTKLLAEDYIKMFHERGKSFDDPSERMRHADDFVFTGAVKKIEHEEVSSSVAKPFIRSEITFSLNKLYKYPEAQTDFTEVKELSVSVRSCGQAYRVGRTYLITAQEGANFDAPLKGSCAWPTGWMLDEKDYLRSLEAK